ncbi:hypothetical protein ANO11243_092060 [Dothideomycetidae sp. 11243]|nr:hypothetical protein ANO11243_092060 [fungal sp. No.11243]
MGDPISAFPSFEAQSAQARRKQELYPRTSLEVLQIRWTPFGVLASCIEIVEDPRDPASACRPYMTSNIADSISTQSITEPPVSSITVRQADIEMGGDMFLEAHIEHADDDNPSAIWEEAPVSEEAKQRGETPSEKLMQCCGIRRPRKSPTLTVLPTAKSFVTVGDYIAQVHPWLQTLRDEIIFCRNLMEGAFIDLDTPLYVRLFNLSTLSLDEEDSGTGSNSMGLWEAVSKVVRERGAITSSTNPHAI